MASRADDFDGPVGDLAETLVAADEADEPVVVTTWEGEASAGLVQLRLGPSQRQGLVADRVHLGEGVPRDALIELEPLGVFVRVRVQGRAVLGVWLIRYARGLRAASGSGLLWFLRYLRMGGFHWFAARATGPLVALRGHELDGIQQGGLTEEVDGLVVDFVEPSAEYIEGIGRDLAAFSPTPGRLHLAA